MVYLGADHYRKRFGSVYPHYLIAAIGPAPAVGYFGLVLIILGLLLRIGAIRSLGNSLRCR